MRCFEVFLLNQLVFCYFSQLFLNEMISTLTAESNISLWSFYLIFIVISIAIQCCNFSLSYFWRIDNFTGTTNFCTLAVLSYMWSQCHNIKQGMLTAMLIVCFNPIFPIQIRLYSDWKMTHHPYLGVVCSFGPIPSVPNDR